MEPDIRFKTAEQLHGERMLAMVRDAEQAEQSEEIDIEFIEEDVDMSDSTLTGFRIAYRKGIADCDAGIGETYEPTMVGLAMALDDCEDENAEGRGAYGKIGWGGASVEACFDGDPDDEDTEAERIDSLGAAERTCGQVEFGNRSAARRFRVAQRKQTVWDGNNHIACSTYHVDALLKT